MVVIFCGQKLSHLLPKNFEYQFNSNLPISKVIVIVIILILTKSNCNCNHYTCFQEVIGVVMITFGK